MRGAAIGVTATAAVLLGNIGVAVACPVCPSDGASSAGGAELPLVLLAVAIGGLGAIRLGQWFWRRYAAMPAASSAKE